MLIPYLVSSVHNEVNAQYAIPHSVFGSGATAISNNDHKITGTLGQPLIGQSKNSTTSGLGGFWHQVIALQESLISISLPDTSARQFTKLVVPITVNTDSMIGLGQFVLEYDSSEVSFESAQVNSQIPGFVVSQVNENLPFAPTNSNSNKNVLIQISGGGAGAFSGLKDVIDVTLTIIGSPGAETIIYFDQSANHTFLTTINLTELTDQMLSFKAGTIQILAPKFDINGEILYTSSLIAVPGCVVSLQGIGFEETGLDGSYEFTDLPIGKYTMIPETRGKIGSAISGADALVLLRYLAFLQSLDENQMHAADVTNDRKVSGSDGLAMLRYLAFYSTNIGQIGQWRFFPAQVEIMLPPDAKQDFQTTIVGDVTQNWTSTTHIAKAQMQHLAQITLPELNGTFNNDTLLIPISMSTDSSIGLAQFTMEYDSTVLQFISAQIGADAGGFVISAINNNLPFSPINEGMNNNVLIQINGGGTGTIYGENQELLVVKFLANGEITNQKNIRFDLRTTHTFLTTENSVDIQGSDLKTVTQGIITSVELLNFEADVVNNQVILTWTVVTEQDILGFDIERSEDNHLFETIGFAVSNEEAIYSFVDANAGPGKKFYRLKWINLNAQTNYLSVIEVIVKAPGEFQLLQNYPNPFNPTTSIPYHVPRKAKVIIKIFDVLGQEIVTLLAEEKEPGYHFVIWDGKDEMGRIMSSGVYLCRMKVDNFTQIRKLLLTK